MARSRADPRSACLSRGETGFEARYTLAAWFVGESIGFSWFSKFARAEDPLGCPAQVRLRVRATPIARNMLFEQGLAEEMEFTAAPRASKPVLCKQTASEIRDSDQIFVLQHWS